MSAFTQIRSLHVRADEDADASLEPWRALRDGWTELEELVLVGQDCVTTWRLAQRVLAERWPRLRRLTIGEIALDAAFILSFMQAHPDLEELRLCGDVSPPDGGQVIPSSLLPHLRVFEGKLFKPGQLKLTMLTPTQAPSGTRRSWPATGTTTRSAHCASWSTCA
jgi:hypothetical protein